MNEGFPYPSALHVAGYKGISLHRYYDGCVQRRTHETLKIPHFAFYSKVCVMRKVCAFFVLGIIPQFCNNSGFPTASFTYDAE